MRCENGNQTTLTGAFVGTAGSQNGVELVAVPLSSDGVVSSDSIVQTLKLPSNMYGTHRWQCR